MTPFRFGLRHFSAAVSRVEASKAAEKRPVSVLLGWAFGEDSHLAKYAELHNKHGRDAIRFNMPTPWTFTNDQPKQRKYAEENIAAIKAEFGPKVDIVIHCFSNNGFNHFGHVESLVRNDPDMNIKGVIFDSCPRPFTVLAGYLVPPTGWWGLNVAANKHMPPLAFFAIVWLTQGYGLFKSIRESLKVHSECVKNWVKYKDFDREALILQNAKFEPPGSYPLLYIYSTKDIMAASNFIAGLSSHIKRKKTRTVITKHYWLSSHVGHFKRHPEEYEELVKQLLSEAK